MNTELKLLLENHGISAERFSNITELIQNQNKHSADLEFRNFPLPDDKNIISSIENFSCPYENAARFLKKTDQNIDINDFAEKEGTSAVFNSSGLSRLGLRLLPYTGYGILNGGSASSYADSKKNRSFHPELFQNLKAVFDSTSRLVKGKPKSQTPGYLNPDGSAGYSFIELKLRNLLLCVREYCNTFSQFPSKGLPVFQMTSSGNNKAVSEFQKGLVKSPMLEELIEYCSFSPLPVKTGIQPLLAALDISAFDGDYHPFIYRKEGKDVPLPMPGGHGENFNTLKKIYKQMYSDGMIISSLTNSDNLGSTLNLKENAVAVLSQTDAAFEFSIKTPVDIKGGVLVYTKKARLTCADIGAAIPGEIVEGAAGKGSTILFNCATGIFNLEYLNNKLDYLIKNLPVRVSLQDKDSGRYCQAEQITWEVISLVPDPLIFQVNKYERFMASKLLIENFLMSGHGIKYLNTTEPDSGLTDTAEKLYNSFKIKMKNEYAMKIANRKWLCKDS